MVWDTASKNIRTSNFRSLGWQLLLTYLTIMAAVLGVFATGVYIFLTRSFYNQLDEKLQALAQAAAPSLNEIETGGSQYLEQVDEVPWQDLFNRDRQSLEWFDASGQRLARRGELTPALSLKIGVQIQSPPKLPQIRSFTVPIYTHGSARANTPSLEGYIRASQSTEDLEQLQTQLLWGLGLGGAVALGLAGLGGIWLTRKALQPMEQSFQQLKQFTADASHELRSPLTAIKTSVDVMLIYPNLEPKQVKKLVAISSATAQMSQLLENLLFLARTESTTLTNVSEGCAIALDRLLLEMVELFEPLATSKNITLTTEFVSPSVVGNRTQLSRLFANLLENAIQYTPTGGNVILSLVEQNKWAIVRVKDTGIGIADEHLLLIFNRFWRADQARSRREGGTGLGLAIAQAIANQHRGRITVTSQINAGSCFEVRLPRLFPSIKELPRS